MYMYWMAILYQTTAYLHPEDSHTFQRLGQCQNCLVSEIVTLFKLIFFGRATINAVNERSFSTARRLKTWLRSSMNQIRFNNS